MELADWLTDWLELKMKDKAEGKPTPREIRVAEVKKKKEDFIERNYN